MSAVRIRIGEIWLTGAPGTPQSQVTSAIFPSASARHQMDALAGDQWPAQRFRDLLQKGLTFAFAVTHGFANVTAKANYLATLLSLTPPHPWQGDVIIRWEHEDGIGYTEALIEWAAIRVGSIQEDGPATLRLQYQLLGPGLEDFALYDLPVLLTEDGETWVTEEDEDMPIIAEDYVLKLA